MESLLAAEQAAIAYRDARERAEDQHRSASRQVEELKQIAYGENEARERLARELEVRRSAHRQVEQVLHSAGEERPSARALRGPSPHRRGEDNELEVLFDSIDGNHDGLITRQEFRSAAARGVPIPGVSSRSRLAEVPSFSPEETRLSMLSQHSRGLLSASKVARTSLDGDDDLRGYLPLALDDDDDDLASGASGPAVRGAQRRVEKLVTAAWRGLKHGLNALSEGIPRSSESLMRAVGQADAAHDNARLSSGASAGDWEKVREMQQRYAVVSRDHLDLLGSIEGQHSRLLLARQTARQELEQLRAACHDSLRDVADAVRHDADALATVERTASGQEGDRSQRELRESREEAAELREKCERLERTRRELEATAVRAAAPVSTQDSAPTSAARRDLVRRGFDSERSRVSLRQEELAAWSPRIARETSREPALQASSARLDKGFDRIDANHDGLITRQEWRGGGGGESQARAIAEELLETAGVSVREGRLSLRALRSLRHHPELEGFIAWLGVDGASGMGPYFRTPRGESPASTLVSLEQLVVGIEDWLSDTGKGSPAGEACAERAGRFGAREGGSPAGVRRW